MDRWEGVAGLIPLEHGQVKAGRSGKWTRAAALLLMLFVACSWSGRWGLVTARSLWGSGLLVACGGRITEVVVRGQDTARSQGLLWWGRWS